MNNNTFSNKKFSVKYLGRIYMGNARCPRPCALLCYEVPGHGWPAFRGL